MAPLHYLISGGAGYIGSRLAAALVADGHRVTVLARRSSALDRLVPLRGQIAVSRVGLDDKAALAGLLAAARPDCVFHLASGHHHAPAADLSDASGGIADDLGGLVNLAGACAAAAQPPRVLVRAGTLAEYGPVSAPYEEHQREAPMSIYGATMVAGTHYLATLAPRLPFAAVTARLALVYGPGQSDDFLLPRLVRRCLAGQTSYVRRPADRRDLMHVDDAVSGLRRLAERPVLPMVNIATGQAPAMADVAAAVISATGCDPALVRLGDESGGGVPDLVGSPELAAALLGWRAATPFARGLWQTVEAERAMLQETTPAMAHSA